VIPAPASADAAQGLAVVDLDLPARFDAEAPAASPARRVEGPEVARHEVEDQDAPRPREVGGRGAGREAAGTHAARRGP
jgi:hypothetical protein